MPGAHTIRPLTLLLTTVALLAAMLVAPSNPATADRPDDPRAERAKQALAQVEGMLSNPAGFRKAPGARPERGSLTMAMRDLHLHKEALTGSDRDKADQILARPTNTTNPNTEPTFEPKYNNPKRICSDVVCVHYKKWGEHAATDNYAKAVRWAATRAHKKFRNWGFRPPLPDPGGSEFGGNRRRDIYLGNLGKYYFGYAAPENYYPTGGDKAGFGYIVLDNDYKEHRKAWYPNRGWKWQRQLMKVTAAHEYFHLVQFGYDVFEDRWFMESTAAWIEDEVFDGVNDNVNYLWGSPSAMRTPDVPLDTPDVAAYYGNWIFWRFLSERKGRKVVREAWNKADAWLGWGGGRNPADQYSLEATRNAVEAVGGNWNIVLAKFADANRRPWRYYSEAGNQPYPQAPRKPRNGAFSHTKSKREIRVGTHLSRLSSTTWRFEPAGKLRWNWRLQVTVKGNSHAEGGYAIATINKKNGGKKRVFFWLGGDGTKTKKLPYGKSKVKWIEVTVVNASTRYNCDQEQWENTCDGVALDNNRKVRVLTKAVR